MAKKLGILSTIMLLSLALFLMYDMNFEIFFDYIIQKRLEKVLSMILVAVAIGMATLSFQAVTNNRILTPGVLGLDACINCFNSLQSFFYWEYERTCYECVC